MSIIDFIIQLPSQLAELAAVLEDFVFLTIPIGEYNVSIWGLLGGAFIVTLIIFSIVRD